MVYFINYYYLLLLLLLSVMIIINYSYSYPHPLPPHHSPPAKQRDSKINKHQAHDSFLLLSSLYQASFLYFDETIENHGNFEVKRALEEAFLSLQGWILDLMPPLWEDYLGEAGIKNVY